MFWWNSLQGAQWHSTFVFVFGQQADFNSSCESVTALQHFARTVATSYDSDYHSSLLRPINYLQKLPRVFSKTTDQSCECGGNFEGVVGRVESVPLDVDEVFVFSGSFQENEGSLWNFKLDSKVFTSGETEHISNQEKGAASVISKEDGDENMNEYMPRNPEILTDNHTEHDSHTRSAKEPIRNKGIADGRHKKSKKKDKSDLKEKNEEDKKPMLI
ncbi:hypothetical protein BGW36DRAFT_429009 [Talaromyces proteolyticus]|uniref:Uncharacterized protein n=1 Tax=Talaromyces proteolyticus TaxID=1131652 RepID=A0AAD4KR01_9EURO|nr:uncharacterized protein BGW36DRAFT_429009 [Talaromyces proteolyticus]KAH8695121.1 hypothetical protein BGW36DRAFT_429009 [Talaromyces proteolyticus]